MLLVDVSFFRFIHHQWLWILTSTTSGGTGDQNKFFFTLLMLFPIDVSHYWLSMLIFLGLKTAVDVNHLRSSMLIFSLLVTGPEICRNKYQKFFKRINVNWKKNQIWKVFLLFDCILCAASQDTFRSKGFKTTDVKSKLTEENLTFYFQISQIISYSNLT